MKHVKSLFFILFLCSICGFSFAHGKGDIEAIDVDNVNSWKETFDLEGKTQKKAVKYNIMITATDLGGNEHVEGPFNLYVDPESDRPICGITNPYSNMRVVGNLNIVGTCVDDDGVSKVELLLDEGTENEKLVIADGKEFWSYYLDTNNLEEGPHTIKVTGYDINDEPVVSKPVKLTWQLDRKQPLTAVENVGMGQLVSGNVNFKGTVSDGNGIKELYYSVDNGGFWFPVKLSKTKQFDTVEFSINIDTRKFPDGPAVLWFKAIDNATSEGAYSFLYYIDNTKPDVQIVYPVDEPVNGKFTVAGFAKDDVGVTDLSWTFGDQSGVFDLVPGNPYWAITVDTIGLKDKSRKFSVKAIDRAKNVVEVSKTILLNQEEDKPVVTITEPIPNTIYAGDDRPVFVRGFVTDDDSVQSVRIQLDSNEAIIQETKGSYYYELCKASELSAGNHKITIVGIDENGVEGNPVTVQVVSKGIAPVFTQGVVTAGKESVDFVNGMEIHPEAGKTFSVTATSALGIKEAHIEVAGQDPRDEVLKNPTSYTVSIPVNSTFAKGLVPVRITVTDVIDRTTEYKAFFYVTNTALVKNDDPIVVFDDSTVAEDGSIINNPDFPVTGYLIGGNAATVELVPETPFATARLQGNQIKLIPGSAIGGSEPVIVRVTTDKGKVAESRPLIFKNDNVTPNLFINNYTESQAMQVRQTNFTITGSVKCETGVGSLSYRVLGVEATLDKTGTIAKVTPRPVENSFQNIPVEIDGNFSLNFETYSLPDGMYIVEFIAESAGGNKVAKAVALNNLPEIEEINGKMPAAKAQIISWIDAFDVYAITTYQGELDENFRTFARADMQEGANALVFGNSKYTAQKAPTLSANIAEVNGEEYYSGMPVVLPYGVSKEPKYMRVYIDTGAAVNAVNYEITGEEVSGGDQRQTGAVKLGKPEGTRWTADIPLNNLPSRVNKINITIKAGALQQVITGSITVIRDTSSDVTDDQEKIYSYADVGTFYDSQDKNWVLLDGSKYVFYANVTGPIKAELEGNSDGLFIETDGKFVVLSATKDGVYKDIVLKVTDRFGDTFQTEAMNFLADSESPQLVLQTPVLHDWLSSSVKLSGTIADALGVRRAEYSLDGCETWRDLQLNGDANGLGVTFSEDVNITFIEDGLVRLDLRAYDNAGHTALVTTAAFKDTTPPEVTVIEPLSIDIVNGENLIAFKVKDNGWFNKAEYLMIAGEEKEEKRVEIPLEPLVNTHVGTEEKPIDDIMQFIFIDDAGNKTTIEGWDFTIDNKSDLPVAEIHVPDELQVITRDFTISGVVYDDDGPSTIWYKIDDNEYQMIPEPGTSFSIDVPLASMTDNEHTIYVYAVDINGVQGEVTQRTFRISLEEPKGSVEKPTIDTSVREVITISGVASDKNGIMKVELSLDNGNSYNDAVGQEEWSYQVDTRAIPGGTQVVFLRITDNYGIKGLYSSLINIDNEAPDISLDLPLDDSTSTGQLFFSGYAFDNVEISDLYITIRNMEKTSEAIKRTIPINNIIGETLDITDLSDGFYNVELSGEDKAGNRTNVSRNIHLDKSKPPAVVDVLYPLNGEHKNGNFNIYGQASSNVEGKISSLKLYVDDKFVKETSLSDSNFFKFEITPAAEINTGELDYEGNPIKTIVTDMTDGTHTYYVEAVLEDGRAVPSITQSITYSSIGPWITLDNFTYGDFAMRRPYLKGRAGYSRDPEEVAASKSKEATKEYKDMVAAKAVAKVELSFDNGKTFELLSENDKWLYRVENQDWTEGYHFLLIRATMKNGEVAIERTIVQIDNTAPTVRLIAPNNGGRYNQMLEASGLSKDEVGLEKVNIALRKGDKASYEVPSFIQGLYVDFHFWGASLYEVGAGLTFFDDNVKLQFIFGQYTQEQRDAVNAFLGNVVSELRYGGNIFGGKLLANISTIPFSFFFGHDFDWLSASIAVGAQFNYFSQTNSGSGQILSAVLSQLEFPRVHINEIKAFSTFSMYYEFSLWFIPSDVASEDIKKLVPQGSIGLRVNIF
ncbi:MAG: hypothetical protein J5710_05645 [Treponema sp.]|nr:hypothetical protein [Treponema sp.]